MARFAPACFIVPRALLTQVIGGEPTHTVLHYDVYNGPPERNESQVATNQQLLIDPGMDPAHSALLAELVKYAVDYVTKAEDLTGSPPPVTPA